MALAGLPAALLALALAAGLGGADGGDAPPAVVALGVLAALAAVAVAAAWRARARDCTALRAEVHALDQRMRRKDEFLAGISHELRTPLNVVVGYASLLLDGTFGGLVSAQRDILGRITGNARDLSHLLNDLLDLTRLEAGRLQAEIGDVAIAPLIAELATVPAVLITRREVTFRAVVDSGCAAVRADPYRLRQIITNLLANAVKFTDRGSIELRAASDGDGRVTISVTDTGIGIPPGEQEAIFDPFRQVPAAGARHRGAGIGLAIAARLTALMNGRLRVESVPGCGSRFSVSLPVALTPARPPGMV